MLLFITILLFTQRLMTAKYNLYNTFLIHHKNTLRLQQPIRKILVVNFVDSHWLRNYGPPYADYL